jgi:predicted DNA-binding transcriptional regulator AlpA
MNWRVDVRLPDAPYLDMQDGDSGGQEGAVSVIEQQNTFKPVHEQTSLTPVQAAKYLGVSEGVLRLWRSKGEGPRHFKAGEKLIRYRRIDLDSWIEAHLSASPENMGRRP